VHSRSHENNEKFTVFLGKTVAEKRVCGSSVKFCLLAAGGSMTTLDGAPFRYGKPGLRNPGFIARGL
jgi:3'(2'), 5'-bisphosphate nucleotidase